MLQKSGTYSGCLDAWSIRPTRQSLWCDITAVGITDITAIDCDLLPNDYTCSLLAIGSYWHCEVTWLTMLTYAESRPLAPTGPARKTCQHKVNLCKHSKLTITIKLSYKIDN